MSPDGCGTMLVVIRRGAEQKQFFITIINNTRVKCHLNLTGPKVHALYFFIILDIEVFWKIHVNDNLSVRFSLNRLRVLYWCRILYTCTWRQSLDMFSLKSLGNDRTEPFSSSRTVIDTMDAVSSPLAPFFIFLRVVLSIFSMPLANLDHDLLMKPSADYMFHMHFWLSSLQQIWEVRIFKSCVDEIFKLFSLSIWYCMFSHLMQRHVSLHFSVG